MVLSEEINEIRMKQAAEWIKAQAESGLTKEDWCEQNGIKRWVFYKYQRKLRNRMLKSIEGSCVTGILPEIIGETEQQPVFIEIPDSKPCTSVNCLPAGNNYNYNNDYNSNDSYANHRTIAESQSTRSNISISCGDFIVSVTGDTDIDLLTAVLRAARNA